MALVYWHCPLCDKSGEVASTDDPYKDGIMCFKRHCLLSPDCPEVKSFGSFVVSPDPQIIPPSRKEEK